jgi:O-antigen/teichoic acid export membrane protein/thymidylate kinase
MPVEPVNATEVRSGEADLTARTFAGLAWTAGGKAVYAVLRLLVLFILARLVSPADFGVVGAASVVIGFSAIFSQLGMAPALVQRPVLELAHEQTAFSTSVAFGLFLGALLWLLAPDIAAFFRIPAVEPVLRTFAWTFPLAGLSIVGEAMMQRDLRFRWLATVEVVSFVVGYGVVGVTLALIGYGVWALVAAEMSKVALQTTCLLLARPPRLSLRPHYHAFADLLYYGGGFTVSKIANYLALQLDNIIVGRWLGATALGFYGRAYELMAGAPMLLGEPVDKVLFPAMAARQDNLQALASAFRRGVAAMALITLPLSAILLALAPDAIPALLGPRWTPVVRPFQILTFGMFLRTSNRISDVVARATGAVYRRAWRQTAYMLCVMAGAWFGRRWGIAGVAFGVLGALMVNYTLMADLGVRLVHLSWRRFWTAHLPGLLTAGAAGALMWGFATMLRGWGLSPWAVVVVAGVLGLGGLFLIMWAAPRVFLGDDGLWLLRQIRKSVSWPAVSQASAPAIAPAREQEPLSLVVQLGAELEREGVRYCQWKSHAKWHRWATGAGDIDLLVDPAHADRLSWVLGRLGFLPVVVPPHQRLSGAQSYFGLDARTGRLVHVHAHRRLLVGRPWYATYALGLEELFLTSATPSVVFRTPAPEFELIGLVLRIVERYGLTTALRRQEPGSAATLQEWSHLETRIDGAKLARALEQIPFLDARFFETCRQSLRPAFPRAQRVLLRWQLLRRLRARAVRPAVSVAWTTLLRWARSATGRRPGDARKRFVGGGVVIALAGGDGAGKSTCARELLSWLSPAFESASFHLGKPRRSVLTLVVAAVLWGQILLERLVRGSRSQLLHTDILSGRTPGLLELLRHLCTARDRYRLALEARRLAAGGAVVVCERYPDITTLAGPTIQQLQYPMPQARVAHWLVTAEVRYYERIPPPDCVAVLLVEPEVAVQRKQDEPAPYVRRRAQLVKDSDWTGTEARLIDANRGLPEVVRDLKCVMWSVLTAASDRRRYGRPVVVELAGPAGVGKSAVADALRTRSDAVRVSIWGLPPQLLLGSGVALLPLFLRLYLETRAVRWEEMTQMIRLGALRRFMARAASKSSRLIVLDEGPVFALSWLRVFGTERLLRSAAYDRWVRRTLIAWAPVLDIVALLDAPDPILTQRIRSRAKPHMVKHQNDQQIAAFAARFRVAFAWTLAAVTRLNGTRRISVPADRESPDAIADQVLRTIRGFAA